MDLQGLRLFSRRPYHGNQSPLEEVSHMLILDGVFDRKKITILSITGIMRNQPVTACVTSANIRPCEPIKEQRDFDGKT